jgi:hypothetical protein
MNDTLKNRGFLKELNLLAIEILAGKSNLKIKVLYEEKAIQLALKYQYTLKSVYVEAMKLGVCPYTFGIGHLFQYKIKSGLRNPE